MTSLWELASFGGVMFPAHVEKSANSLIANLGFVPPDSRFKTAELKDLKKLHQAEEGRIRIWKDLQDYQQF